MGQKKAGQEKEKVYTHRSSSKRGQSKHSYRFGTFEGTVAIDSNGGPLLPLVIVPIFGTPLPANPLPLLGRPPGPPCHPPSPPNPYPKGALSLLARLGFFPGPPMLPNPGPVAVPGDDNDDGAGSPSTAGPRSSSFDSRCLLVLIRPAGSQPGLSSNRSMVAEIGDGDMGDVPSPREYAATC